jgi:regulator of sigma E protease
MLILWQLIVFLSVISVLVIAHEYGHFLAARKSGVKVEQFAIGFGPQLLKIKGKETDFYIKAVPLGGYIKMAGESRQEASGQPDEFFSKPVGVRALIVFAGPFFNYILAYVFFFIIMLIGFPYPEPVVGEVMAKYPAATAGVKENDRILLVNGKKIENWYDVSREIASSKNNVEMVVDRKGARTNLNIPLVKTAIPDEFGRKRATNAIGVRPSGSVKIVKYNFLQAFGKAREILFSITVMIVKGFWLMITGAIPFKESVAGPLGIFYITSKMLEIGIGALLNLMAALSVSLAIMNLLPLPLLDGGHLFLFGIEKLRKKPISDKTDEVITKVGFAMLGVLFVVILFNDIGKFGSKIWSPDHQGQRVTGSSGQGK